MKIVKTKKSKKLWFIISGCIVVAIAVFAFIKFRSSGSKVETVKTATVERANITSTVTSSGVIQPYTSVEVKSNVGGQIVELLVDEGDVITTGQIIARVDPSDTKASLEQAQADYTSALSRIDQAKQSLLLQEIQTATGITQAIETLKTQKQRLEQAELQAAAQPKLTESAVKQAESNYASAEARLKTFKTVTYPQQITSVKASYSSAKASFDQAANNLERNKALYEKGYTSKSQVETAEQQYASAKAQLDNAKSKLDTINTDLDQQLLVAEADFEQAKASLESAKANQIQVQIKLQDLAVAKASVAQAEAALNSARAGSFQISSKKSDIIQANASLTRTNASLDNAKTQLGYTTITSPCSGVVVKKYVEIGSIVTAGRSAFSGSGSGVTIVEIADTTRMMVNVNVDETDIGQIKIGQKVKISVDAYPDAKFSGKVEKIAPKATVQSNVTVIPVTIEIDKSDPRLKPEMNANCDFIVSSKENVLSLPVQAVVNTKNGATVTVQMKNGETVSKPVKTGISSNDKIEILEGLDEGDIVIINNAKGSSKTTTNSGPPRMF